ERIILSMMLVSHSPPVFSHSPPTGFLSQNFSSLRGSFSVPRLQRATSFPAKNPSKMPTVPRRPILVIRTPEETSSDEDPISPTKIKKKVVFADDKGMTLTHVRMMTEPSNVPPMWSKRFLAEVTQGISTEPIVSNNHWEIMFPQPASDYIKFRHKLDAQKVSLENIMIKDNGKHVVGTIKVANLSFEKTIFIRSSCDDWISHDNVMCTYVPNTLPSSTSTAAYVLHDTFTFDLDLPSKSRRLEFCICYKCNETEYWDNNDNKNYLLLNRIYLLPRANSSDSFLKTQEKTNDTKTNGFASYIEATQTKMDSWSEFASWTHLENSTPYW
ncbi:hypothetical protein HHI36_013638, partial [Cryptolaemus montrouzieri]